MKTNGKIYMVVPESYPGVEEGLADYLSYVEGWI